MSFKVTTGVEMRGTGGVEKRRIRGVEEHKTELDEECEQGVEMLGRVG